MTEHLYMINDMAKLAELRHKQKLIICEFYTEWCPPCKPTRVYIEKIVKQAGGKFLLACINCDEAEQLNIQYQIQGVPTVVLLRCDQELSIVDRLTGYDDGKLKDFMSKAKEHAQAQK